MRTWAYAGGNEGGWSLTSDDDHIACVRHDGSKWIAEVIYEDDLGTIPVATQDLVEGDDSFLSD